MGLFAKLPTSDINDLTLNLLYANEKKRDGIEMRTSFFPAEWFSQSGIQLTWPHTGTDWKDILKEVTECYIRIAYEISTQEKLLIVTPDPEKVKVLLTEKLPHKATDNIQYFRCDTNDTWTRDYGFLTVLTNKNIELLDFRFNGWGNKFPAELDNAINAKLYKNNALKGTYKNCLDFVLEGGSIESDGRGTLLSTTQCLLSPERNPQYSKTEIEEKLLHIFHANRILWLEHGHLTGDDTNSHIDTLARFCPNDVIAYTQCTNKNDEQYYELSLMEQELKAMRTLENEPYKLLPLPLPDAIYYGKGEKKERLPGTYANFLILNNKILMPTYNQPEKDEMAIRIIQQAFHKYSVIGIDCCVLIKQHGSLHCSAMQYPVSVLQ